jgi:ketosteroid isomerase-like protein
MNEQENIRLVQEGYRLFLSGDIDNLLKIHTRDSAFIFHGTSYLNPFTDTFRGDEELRQFFQTVSESLDFELYELDEFIAQGDKVIVLGHDKSRTKDTGKTIVEERVHVFTVQDGKVLRLDSYGEVNKMMAAYALVKPQEV